MLKVYYVHLIKVLSSEADLKTAFTVVNHPLNKIRGSKPMLSNYNLDFVFNVHLKELTLLLDGESGRLGVVLRERIASDSPNK